MELQLNQLSDQDLVAASKGGDRAAYAALVRRHSRRVYAVCLGILGSVNDSEDMFQETFVKGMTRIDSIRDGNQFAGWISQIARNLCRDQFRRRSRHRELAEQIQADESYRPRDFTDLHIALERLPEKHRLPLMLFYFDGKSSEKLAEELNLTKAGACTRLFRARNELRKLLGEKEHSK